MPTPAERLQQVHRLLVDPVVDLTDREMVETVYHALMYELHQFRIDRIQRRKVKHGSYLCDLLEIANFKHELDQL